MSRLTTGRTALLAVTALSVASVTYGFAASNTVPTARAGDGSGSISGYTVSNVRYTLNTSNPDNIDAALFDLAGGAVKPSTVKVQLVTPGGSWYSCTSSSTGSPYAYSCATTSPQITTSAANQLRVVAAD